MQQRLVFTIAVAFLVAVGVSVYVLSQKKNTILSPTVQEYKETSTMSLSPSENKKNYTDESGFTFSYPEDLTLKKNDSNDVRVYTDIALTSTRLGGGVSVKVSDSPFPSLENWVKAQKLDAPAQKGAAIGRLEAYEIITPTRRTTAAIDQGILFVIETTFEGKESFWSRVHSDVVSTFTFTATQESGAGATSSEEEVIVEEELIE